MTIETLETRSGHVIDKNPIFTARSQRFYERSQSDPFDFVDPKNQSDRHKIREADLRGLDDAIYRRDGLETAEYAADLAYLDFLEDTNDVRVYTTQATDALEKRLSDRSMRPVNRLGAQIRLLDMDALEMVDDYQRAIVRLKGPEKANALAILEARFRANIERGVAVLESTHAEYASLEGSGKLHDIEARDDLAGKMFELLYITNRRRQVFAREEFDETLILGATEFQDRPALSFPERHNFDVMEVSAAGDVTRLVQCKAGGGKITASGEQKRDGVYHPRIDKVVGRGVSRFFEDPALYVHAIRTSMYVGEHISNRVVKEAAAKVDSLFDVEHSQRAVGGETLKSEISV